MMRQLDRRLCLLLVAPPIVAACAVVPTGQAPAVPLFVRTAPVVTGTIAGTIVFSGNVASRDTVSVLPKIPGQIGMLNVDQAQAALAAAQVAHDQATVKAPIDGVVAQKLVGVGAMAAPTTLIATLVDPRVDAILQVDPESADLLKVGQSATIRSDAVPGQKVAGSVTQIAPTVDLQTRTVQVTVSPTNQNSVLKDGMLAQVAIVTTTHLGVLVVPVTAIVQRDGQPTVFVVVDGIATPHVVTIGLTDGMHTEITRGLKAGDQIVVSGQERLTGAAPVTVQK